MQNTHLVEVSGKTGSEHFHPQYGPGADKWLVDGILPQVGIALLEADSLKSAAIVADDIGACVVAGDTWGGRYSLQGPAIEYNAKGEGRHIDGAEYAYSIPMLPRLQLPSVLNVESVEDLDKPARETYHFPDEIACRRGCRLLIVHVPDDAAKDPVAQCAFVDLARDIQCCVLLVATTGKKWLHDLANSVLRIEHAADENNAGSIVQSKISPNRDPAKFTYTLDALQDFGNEDVAYFIVGEVWEVAQNVQ